MQGTNRGLMWHGMCLFLLGLLTGFAELRFANMRMGLAAHLEGVMNGTFLVALGAVWTEVRLSPPARLRFYRWTTHCHVCPSQQLNVPRHEASKVAGDPCGS